MASARDWGHEGPYFDDLSIGDVVDSAPALTLTDGRAAVHQSILGGRLRLSLDSHLSHRVVGSALADPALVWDVAIGQSTLVTKRVVANLFYRGLTFHRLPAIGETLHTRSEVVGLRQTVTRPSGLAALRVTTRDQHERLVLDFWRCAMLPLSRPDVRTEHADSLDSIGSNPGLHALLASMSNWDLDVCPRTSRPEVGQTWTVNAGDVVSNAPELARLTLNLAHVHHDHSSQKTGRLVYGGHTIGLALAQITRTLPNILTVAGWRSCEHLGPVREGDTLISTIEVTDIENLTDTLVALTLRVEVSARRSAGMALVLRWHLVVIALTCRPTGTSPHLRF